MSLALYMDHHVPAAITEGLRQRGIDVVTAQEDGAAELDDDPLLERATADGRILFTQDADFLVIAERRRQENRRFAGVVFAHQLAVTIGMAVHDLEILCQVLDPADIESRVEFLPL